MTEFVRVSTATRDEAVSLARSAVQARLAAGAQVVGPVASVVWHLGELMEGEEWQVLLHTRTALYPVLEAHIIERHPWQRPEIAAVPLTAGSAAYLNWLRRTTGSA